MYAGIYINILSFKTARETERESVHICHAEYKGSLAPLRRDGNLTNANPSLMRVHASNFARELCKSSVVVVVFCQAITSDNVTLSIHRGAAAACLVARRGCAVAAEKPSALRGIESFFGRERKGGEERNKPHTFTHEHT